MIPIDAPATVGDNLTEQETLIETFPRASFFKALDAPGYVPMLGSLIGGIRIITGFCIVKTLNFVVEGKEGAEKENLLNRIMMYSDESNRGFLELFPFASAIHDFVCSKLETNRKEPISTVAYGNYTHYVMGDHYYGQKKYDLKISAAQLIAGAEF